MRVQGVRNFILVRCQLRQAIGLELPLARIEAHDGIFVERGDPKNSVAVEPQPARAGKRRFDLFDFQGLRIDAAGIDQVETTDLDLVLAATDVLYVTRIQKERFSDPSEYDQVKDSYVITPQTMLGAKEKMALMHPLPRVGEITTDVDADPRAAYFRQMEYGMYIRMALLALVLGKA